MPSAAETIASVTVVVPTIGRARLAEVVGGVLADPATGEVVVVADRDRARVDELVAMAASGDPRVVVVAGEGRGPAAARQTGIERATGELVVLLDDDVVPAPGLVTAHRAAHASGTRAVVVGPMPVAADLRATSAVARLYANDYDAEWSRHLERPDSALRDLWGGNVSVRRVDALAVPQVGPLGDLRNREDQEWGLRARSAGLRGAVAPEAVAVHWHDGTATALLAAAVDQVRTGRLIATEHPDLRFDGDPRDGLPRRARPVVDLADAPVVGRLVRAATVALARRLGDGPPARWRVRLLVIARALVQRAA
jgi:glycosyltransferase involved in cell wall biosynthesis